MLVSVKVGQKFVMDRIREFGSYDSCPESMAIDPDTELAFFQCDMEYEVESTNGRTKRADRLRLNLYLDVRRRAMTLLRLRLELDSQRRELEELLRKKARLDDAAGQEKQVDDAGGMDARRTTAIPRKRRTRTSKGLTDTTMRSTTDAHAS